MIASRLAKLQGIKALKSVCSYSTKRAVAPANTKMWIDGTEVESKATYWIDLTNPATGELIGKVPQCNNEELNQAVDSAKQAYKKWRNVSLNKRVQILFKFRDLMIRDTAKLVENITEENGKTIAESHHEVNRCLQLLEHALTATVSLTGRFMQSIATDLDTIGIREPLGVCGAITPFNFPIMCTSWIAPMALAAGNTVLLKPSEQDPGANLIYAKLLQEAGLPDGCFNVVHGQNDTVNFICDHPDIQTVSFVGGNTAGEHIYKRASQSLKRVQCNMGAKCLSIVLPDANKAQVFKQLISGCYGCAGQRCLAVTTAVMVGKTKEWIPELVDEARQQKFGPGTEPGVDYGPMISKGAKQRCIDLIESARGDGCPILLDGTKFTVPGHENGYYVGPTVISGVHENMRCYEEELFGPAICTMNVDTLDHAIDVVNRNPFGNGTSIFTSSGPSARKFCQNAEPGMVGVNVPVPIPIPTFSFSGNKKSFAGEHNYYGQMGFQFFTQEKTIISAWAHDLADKDVYALNFGK